MPSIICRISHTASTGPLSSQDLGRSSAWPPMPSIRMRPQTMPWQTGEMASAVASGRMPASAR